MRGVFLNKIMRRSVEIPIGPETIIERGDTLVISGAETVIVAAAKELGEVVQPTEVTDFVAVGLAIFIGALIGAALSFTVGGVVPLLPLLFSWMRMTARSIEGSCPTSSAGWLEPSAKVTISSWAFSTTWKLVTMWPWSS